MAGTDSIGPYDPIFNPSVGGYLKQSPTPDQKRCLAQFFHDLRDGRVTVDCDRSDDHEIEYIYICEHIIKITGRGAYVRSIEPAEVQ